MKEKKEKPYVVTDRKTGAVRLIRAHSKSKLMHHLLDGFDIRPMKPEDLMNMVDVAVFESASAPEDAAPQTRASPGEGQYGQP